ncbi:MAG: 16S rRNA (guanine(527)-N(7))-methyltransferase RsmG [Candidatus Eremiobacteraeota bacterium]|nr:16S rRNA (guanine(527)-N(7))-methyltransferase RsmG [Candidatus Eremiobacteraeota bacterium]
MRAELEALLAAAGVDDRIVSRLALYGARVLEANRSFNLTGAKSALELTPHLVDSLTVVPYVGDTLIDVGSGAGLPGIPVAIATGAPITLIESTAKKARFLQRALAEFALAGEVVAARAEVAARDDRLRDAFASGTARAVSTAPAVAELLLPFIKPGGVAILQRGTMDERERTALADATLVLAGEIAQEVPLAGDRRIILVRKTGATPLRFPRRTGIPEKRPLCS